MPIIGLKIEYLKPEPMDKQTCNAIIEFGDDYGDNTTTFHCNLPWGHKWQHQETGISPMGQVYKLTWYDNVKEPEIDDSRFKE